MTIIAFQVADPYHTPWARWTGILVEDLTPYNVPNPVPEDLWLQWALQVFAIPELVELGVADPRNFKRWQDWAATFSQVSN